MFFHNLIEFVVIGFLILSVGGASLKELIKFKQVEYENLPSEFHVIKFLLSHKTFFLKIQGIFLISLTITSPKDSLLILPKNEANSRKFLSLFHAEIPGSHRR